MLIFVRFPFLFLGHLEFLCAFLHRHYGMFIFVFCSLVICAMLFRNGIHHILSYMYARLPLIFDRFERICQLYQYFTSDETIQQYMKILGVGKGRKLLARVLPLFNKVPDWSI